MVPIVLPVLRFTGPVEPNSTHVNLGFVYGQVFREPESDFERRFWTLCW